MVSGKWYPVSRKITSSPLLTFEARWMITASVMDDVMQIRDPNVSTAQRMISSAGASASSSAAWAASLSMRIGSSRGSGSETSGTA